MNLRYTPCTQKSRRSWCLWSELKIQWKLEVHVRNNWKLPAKVYVYLWTSHMKGTKQNQSKKAYSHPVQGGSPTRGGSGGLGTWAQALRSRKMGSSTAGVKQNDCLLPFLSLFWLCFPFVCFLVGFSCYLFAFIVLTCLLRSPGFPHNHKRKTHFLLVVIASRPRVRPPRATGFSEEEAQGAGWLLSLSRAPKIPKILYFSQLRFSDEFKEPL